MALEFSDQFLAGKTQNAGAASEAAIVYSLETYGSIAAFESDETVFEAFKKQFQDEIDRVKQFAEASVKKKDDKSDASGLSSKASEKITANLERFKKDLFEKNRYSKHKERLYSTGKETFSAFSELLRDDGLPRDKRLKSLQRMAEKITGSGGDVADVLRKAVDELDFPKLVYSPEQYESMETFLKHRKFHAFRKEFEEEIDRLMKFAEDHARKEGDANDIPRLSIAAIEEIRQNLNRFKTRLFSPHIFSQTEKELIYNEGKTMFFNYGRLLCSGKASLDKCLPSLKNVAEKMAVCSGGMMTELQDETDNLNAFIQGYDAKVRNLIQTVARQIIVEFARKRHNFGSMWEVHYVNRYFNHIARSIGCVPRKHDRYIEMVSGVTKELLDECKAIVLREVQPMRLAPTVAQQYLDMMTGAVSHLTSPDGTIPPDNVEQVGDILEGMQKNQEGVYGEINANSVLVTFDTVEYKLASRPTLITVELLEHMEQCGLLTGSKQEVLAVAGETPYQLNLMGWDGRLFWVREWTSAKNSDRLLLRVEDLQHFSPEEVAASLASMGEQIARHFMRNNLVGETIAGLSIPEAAAIPDDWLRYAPLARMLGTLQDADQEEWIAFLQRALEHDADTEGGNRKGETPLLVAAKRGLLDIVAALISKGANAVATDPAGRNALVLALQSERDDQTVEQWDAMFRSLIEKGVKIEETNNLGKTSLLLTAARQGRINAAIALLGCGADPKVKDDEGNDVISLMMANVRDDPTVEQWAAFFQSLRPEHKRLWAEDQYLRRGEDQLLWDKYVDIIDARNGSSRAPLLEAAWWKRTNAFTALADVGANLEAKDVQGANALMWAVRRGADDIGADFIARVRGDGPLTREIVLLLNPPEPKGFGVQDYALLNNCPKIIEAHSNFLLDAWEQNLVIPDDFKEAFEGNWGTHQDTLNLGYAEAMRAHAEFLVKARERSLISQTTIKYLVSQCLTIRRGALADGHARIILAANQALEKFMEKGWLPPLEAFGDLFNTNNREARQSALARGRTAALEADYELLEKAIENRWLTKGAYEYIARSSVKARFFSASNGCAAALEVDNQFHLRARREGRLDNATLKKLLEASNLREVEIRSGSPQEAAMRVHGKAVLEAYGEAWLKPKDLAKLEPARGWLKEKLPEEWRLAERETPGRMAAG
jgi:ankyrin repeat protein